jgi:glucose-1-phosphate adenylyltransferase
VNEGSVVLGTVEHSVLSSGVRVEKGAVVTNSVLMPFAKVEAGAVVDHAIVGQGGLVESGAHFEGADGAVCVIGDKEVYHVDGTVTEGSGVF